MSDEGFIGLPPGITPPLDSGTVRRDRPERTRTAREEITFFPAGAAPVVTPVPDADVPDSDVPASGASELEEATRLSSARHAAPAWRLVVPGHPEPVPLVGRLFLGRSPSPTPGATGEVLAVDDPARSVSKTHALLELDATGLWVSDLDSTNGVWVVPAQGDPVEVIPGVRTPVTPGADLELGDFVIQVEHG
jgi:hypothetical protein